VLENNNFHYVISEVSSQKDQCSCRFSDNTFLANFLIRFK
jgi:hypothetical protein